MGSIAWLASYPKSGNTWFRVFITNLLSGLDEPVDINAINEGASAHDRVLFDELTGVETSELAPEELDEMRPEVYAMAAEHHDGTLFYKTHDIFLRLADGSPVYPPAASLGAIYFVRNPLDVAASYANHNNSSVAEAIGLMADPDHGLCMPERRLFGQVPQTLGTWSANVTSWVDNGLMPVHVVKYEDMLARPLEAFGGVLRFLGMEHGEDEMLRALRFSSFGELKRQEAEHGFRERSSKTESFFRKGTSGSWREELSEAEVARVVADHGDVMRRFGYLDGAGRILDEMGGVHERQVNA
jgi:hypothetical protein